MKTLFYDCEIINPIRSGSDWRNYSYLGISVIGAYASWLPKGDRLQAFTADRFDEFQILASDADEVVGFNSIEFDDQLCLAHGIHVQTTYDLMREVRRAAGEPTSGPCTPGYNLARLSEVNLGRKKTGLGSQVPDLWATGEYQQVINYCLNDVELLRLLYWLRDCLKDPVVPGRMLRCDDRLIDWRAVIDNIIGAFGDRVFRIFIEDRHIQLSGKADAVVCTIGVEFFGCARVTLPLFLRHKKISSLYIGLPFYTPPCAPSTYKCSADDPDSEDYDPIPF